MFYLTGDCHRTLNMDKIRPYNFPEGQSLTKDDYVIILGDFGFIWDNDIDELYWRNWFNEQPFTVLFIDGNHENFNLLRKFPTSQWKGGKVRFIRDNLIYLERGQVFEIDGFKFFTFGGATSIDKHRRVQNVSWWKQEVPSKREYNVGLENLKKHNFTVDYVLTHTCPTEISTLLGFNNKKILDPTQVMLDRFQSVLTFKKWFFGHFHMDAQILDKYFAVFEDKISLKKNTYIQ